MARKNDDVADIQELDIVRLRIDIYSEGLRKGDYGRVVMLYGEPVKDADVEFPDPSTGGIMLTMVPIKWLERVEDEMESMSGKDII